MKKAIIEHLPALAAKDLVACEVVRGRDYGCQWHFHPEVELLLTLKGGTHRRIGDNISPLTEGDLVLIGSNLPHDFRNSREPGVPFRPVQAIVLQFRPDFLGPSWLERNDMSRVQRLFQLAGRAGDYRPDPPADFPTDETHAGGARHPSLDHHARYPRAVERLARVEADQLTRLRARSADLRPRTHGQHLRVHRGTDHRTAVPEAGRAARGDERGQPESLFSLANWKDVSRVPERTADRARCRLLLETDATVTEIALSCGFDSMANFDQQFSRLRGCSPTTYRQQALRISGVDAGEN
jgi:hypothetical protein